MGKKRKEEVEEDKNKIFFVIIFGNFLIKEYLNFILRRIKKKEYRKYDKKKILDNNFFNLRERSG